MNRIGLRIALLLAVFAGSVAVPLRIWRQARAQRDERVVMLQRLDADIAKLVGENRRLSDVPADGVDSLGRDEFSELLKLRGEIGRLREKAGEAARLQETNRQLRAAGETHEANSGPPPTIPESALAYWPKAQLAFAGHADPTAGLQTALRALSQNDPNALVASVAPETLSKLASSRYPGSNPAEQLAAGTRWLVDSLTPANGFHVVGQELKSSDEAMLDVYFEGEGATRRFKLISVGGQWKLEGVYAAPGGTDGPSAGAKFWP